MTNEQAEQLIIARLKKARLEQGLDYGEISRRTKLHRTTISLIERGLRHPSLLAVLKIAEALHIPCEELLKSKNLTS